MGARVTHIDRGQAIAVAGGLYQPIRRALDLRSFGCNAYFAPNAGDQLIETHRETGGMGAGAHAELYLVWSGHAVFTVDGEEIDAPAGTLVYVPDTASRRGATAAADDTVALVIGAPADVQMPVSPFEYWFVAEGPLRAGDHDEAIRIVEEGLQEHPGHPTMLYQLACYHALAGRRGEALGYFERAAAASARTAEWQDGDSDLDPIRDDPRFQAAVASAREGAR